MTTRPSRLFGVPGSETLHADAAGAYESQIEPWADEHDRRPQIIEEWTVHPPQEHLPSALWVLDYIIDHAADQDVCEGFTDDLDRIRKDDAILAAAQALVDAVADKVTYSMAKDRVAEHQVTWDDQGEPLLDGQPMYVPAAGNGPSEPAGQP